MDASSPASSQLLQLPLFPLQSALFPGGLLPLQIFEVRYLDMIARCHREGTPFGVVCLSQGSEVQKPAPSSGPSSNPSSAPSSAPSGAPSGLPSGDGFAHEAFFEVGTLARIDTLTRPQAGLLIVRCTGTQRFRVRSSARQKFGLWVGAVELLAADSAMPVPADLAFTRSALQDVLRNIERSMAENPATPERPAEIEMPLLKPYQWDDCGWLANRWCELLPVDSALRHRLMTLDSPLLRLELVADTLAKMGFAPPT